MAPSTARATSPEPAPEAPRVVGLEEVGAQAWDRFVDACPEATLFHRAGWKQVIEGAYGHRTHYLCAQSAGAIRGVLPLGRIRSRLFGDSLISTPFAVYGGVAANDEPARRALQEAACRLAEDLRVDHLELRNRSPSRADWPGKDLYATFKREILADPDDNLKAIPRKQRAMVRKGIAAGLASEPDQDIDRFFDAYSESVRNLGTPVHSKSFFGLLKSTFPEHCRVLTVTKDTRVVASVMSFYFRDEVLPYFGGGTAEARALKGNDFMYWELMRRSCLEGVRVFDYGRSKVGTGSFDFKKNWGFEPTPLHYEYFLVKAEAVPDVNPLNPRYQMFIKAWKRLPLPVARALGPMLARSLA